jgi:hypothetical protein
MRSAFADSRGRTYFVCGRDIYSTADFKQFSHRGQIATSQGFISWAESSSRDVASAYLYFTDGTSLWRIDTLNASKSAENLDSHLPYVNGSSEIRAQPKYIAFYQHRLLMTCENSNQWWYSEINPDSREHIFGEDSLNFYSTETRADRLLRVMATDLVYLFGERTVEVWQPTGNNEDPFVSNTATNFGIGTFCPQSVIDYRNAVYFAGTDNCLYSLTGGQMRRVSSGDTGSFFDDLIETAFPLQTNRSRYLVFKRVPKDGKPNDAVLYNPSNDTLTLAPALNGVKASFWLEGEFSGIADGQAVSRQKETALAYSGDALVREVNTPIMFPGSRILVRRFEFSFTISPLASESENERDNQIFVRMSRDGGLSWTESRTVKVTSNQGICRLYGFGWAHGLQFKIVCSNKQMLDMHRMTVFYDLTAR